MGFNKELIVGLLITLCNTVHSTNIKFDVCLPPTITMIPDPEIILKNNVLVYGHWLEYSVELKCKGVGSKPISYTWTRDGNVIDINSEGLVLDDGNLFAKSSSRFLPGIYQCIVSNDYGKAVSTTSVLRKISVSGNASKEIQIIEVEMGKPFRIPANPIKIFPAANYKWTRARRVDDYSTESLEFGNRIRMSENGDLYFAYASSDDLYHNRELYNVYTLEISNKYEESLKLYTRVNLLKSNRSNEADDFSPLSNANASFPEDNKTYRALVGKDLTLHCFFSAKPEVEYYTWQLPKLSNREVSDLYKDRRTRTPLVIPGITYRDEGTYTCTGSNGIGPNAIKNYNVVVEEAPVFRKEEDISGNRHVTQGDSVTINCKAAGKPTPTNIWYINGKVIDSNNLPERIKLGADKKSLTIENVCRECINSDRTTDLMAVQCNSSNIHGYILISGYLNVLAKTVVKVETSHPIQDGIIKIKDKDYGTYIFQCTVVTEDGSPVPALWRKVVEGKFHEEEVLVVNTFTSVFIEDGQMKFKVYKQDTKVWSDLVGTYRCGANKLFSSQYKSVTVSLNGAAKLLHGFWIILYSALLLLFAS